MARAGGSLGYLSVNGPNCAEMELLVVEEGYESGCLDRLLSLL